MQKKFLKDYDPEVRKYVSGVIDELEDSGALNEKTDILALRMLADSYQTFINASKEVAAQGMIMVSSQGPCVSPFYKISKESQAAIRALIAEFGLSPKARKRLPQLEKTEEDPFEAFLQNNTTDNEI